MKGEKIWLPRYEPPPEIWEALERRIRRRERLRKWGTAGAMLTLILAALIGGHALRHAPSPEAPDRKIFAHYYRTQIQEINRALERLRAYEAQLPQDSLVQAWKRRLSVRRNRAQALLARYER